jgi:hypothetical protein
MTEDGAAPEQVFTTAQVASSLRLGSAMVRKWAVALEKVTGEAIPLKGREGRQFSPAHFEAISKAKALVDTHNGLNIETALQMALGDSEHGLAPAAVPGRIDHAALTAALAAAITKANEPLLAELRELRSELREVRKTELRQIPVTDVNEIRNTELDDLPKTEIEPIKPKTFARLGEKVDSFLRRFK